jgi:hypothetical protein
MRRWSGGFLLAALAACLVGCSATGPRFSEMSESLPSLEENAGRIYFYRDSILGAAVQPEVTVNGQVVGKSQPRSFFFIDRPAGTYRASARTEAEGSIDIVLLARQTAYIEMSINMGFLVGRPAFERVAESEGRKALPSLAYGGTMPLVAKAAKASAPAQPAPIAPAATTDLAPASTATPSSGAPVAAPAVQRTSIAAAAPPAAPAPPAALPPVRSAATAALDATPFAKTSINDLRLLLQATR